MGIGNWIQGILGPTAQDAYTWGSQRPQGPQIEQNPYLSMPGGYNDLIGQLNRQASGQGPSLAGNAYREANQQGMHDVQAMSRGGSAGAARGGMQQMGQLTQGLQQGYSNARLQEQLAARQQLQAALAGASNAWFQPQQANLSATMGQQTNMQQLTSFLQQIGAVGGKLSGAGGAGGA